MAEEPMKTCTRCGERKPTSAFYRRAASPDGLLQRCAECDRAACAVYRERNREEERVRSEVNGRRDPTVWHRRVIASRARVAGVTFVEEVDSLVVLELHDGVCGICGEDVDPFAFEVDHIVPLSRGGFNNYANAQPTHRTCNRSKGQKLMEELAV